MLLAIDIRLLSMVNFIELPRIKMHAIEQEAE